MPGQLAGKTALVIGAGSSGPGWGNGKAAAVRFAREGAGVLCADLNESAARETVEIIRSEGGAAEAVQADASQARDVERAVGACLDRFGRIDVLDNNVGVVEVGGVVDLPESTWDRVLAINLKSCFLTMKNVIPVMQRQGGGSIVNISSIASLGYTGVPYAAYYATKAAVNHLTRTTAVQYAPQQIRVNAVLPGLMKTPMVEQSAALARSYGEGDVEDMWRTRAAQCPMGYMGDAWDVANAVLFLASDQARYITGIQLAVDGGLTQRFA
jgi:NAD(P)-dependent dehydrogenase (short-subunit alcohol dehydrogenase family)